MALPTDKLVDLHVNREGILRQSQRARNKIAAAQTISQAAARKKVLEEADDELVDAMAELKEAQPPGAPTGPTGATGPTGTPTGPSGTPTGPTGSPTGPEGNVPSGFSLLYQDAWPSLGSPFVLGSDNQASAAKAASRTVAINLSGERYEFSMYPQAGRSSPSWAPGAEIFFTTGILVPKGRFTYGGAGHHATISQFFKGIGSAGGGSPTQSLELADYGAGRGLYLADGGSYRKLSDLSEGVHHTLAWRCLGSTGSSGSFDVWLDGIKIGSGTGKRTMQGSTSVAKFGLYGGAGEVIYDHAQLYTRA